MHARSFIILLIPIAIWVGCDRRSESQLQQDLPAANEEEELHPILKQLESLPDGIVVTHSPNPSKAKLGGRSGYKYTWLYATNVTAQTSNVVIEEFGSFTWHKGQWVFVNFTKNPFSASDFADWYVCPNAKLTKGNTYTDNSNWTGSDVLEAGKMKWYFVGRNERGERVKGEAIIETLPLTE